MPAGHAPRPGSRSAPTGAGAALVAAARELLEPIAREVERDPEQLAAELAERDAAHAAGMARLRARHAEAARRPHRHPGAMRRALDALVHAEASHQRQRRQLGRRTALVPSLLDQLLGEVESSAGTGHRTSRGASRSPIALDAAQLVGEIERTVGHRYATVLARDVWAWVRAHASDPHTADLVVGWTARARTLIDPPRPLTLVAACPACGAATVWTEQDGEHVRKAALQVDRVTGWASCLAPRCGATWGPERLPHLASVIEQQHAEAARTGPDAEGVVRLVELGGRTPAGGLPLGAPA